jgi:peroxiredoxin
MALPKLLSAAFTLTLVAASLAADTPNPILQEMRGLRALGPDQRPAATVKLANEIRALPPSPDKIRYADSLSHLGTEADPAQTTLQAIADALTQALTETPAPPAKDGGPNPAYLDLASYVHYAGVTTPLSSPAFNDAMAKLAANDAEIQKVDFTLNDLQGKPVTLSQLRGKVVLVNFWATWCPPCRHEMPDIDSVYSQYAAKGLVVLSVSSDDPTKIAAYVADHHYHQPFLLDPNDQVSTRFHVNGIPKTFVFDREGKLVGQSMDELTRRQFVGLLTKAGLQP